MKKKKEYQEQKQEKQKIVQQQNTVRSYSRTLCSCPRLDPLHHCSKMLGLQQYVMTKSKELSSKLANESSIDPKEHTNEHPMMKRVEGEPGEAFLRAHDSDINQILTSHHQLMTSGEELSMVLHTTRKRLQEQVESEAYLMHHCDQFGAIGTKLSNLRTLVEKIAMEVQDVEQLLLQETEEYMARENACFVSQQQHELEHFEQQIVQEKEGKRKELFEKRRQLLANAFEKDLKTYQTVVSYQGGPVEYKEKEEEKESLESIDLILPETDHLEAFYETEASSPKD